MLAATRAVDPWAWHAHPEVAILFVTVLGLYFTALRRLGTRLVGPGEAIATRRQVAVFLTGVVLLWAVSEWPIHDIAERYLFSVHMFQHMVMTLVAPPLLIRGTPDWLVRWLVVRPPRVYAVVRRLGRPIAAGVIFNVVLAFTHWPALVDAALRSEPLHFGVHLLSFSTAMLMWLPVFNLLPELPRLGYPMRMVYLFLQSLIPTVPASFLTFAEHPVYKFYGHVPRPFALGVLDDQQLAGAMMKVGGGIILWTLIFITFFKWYGQSQQGDPATLTWADVERELAQTNPIP
ncbi:MAG: putative rane protein [Actinomycetota bacterium]|nr:putative rane protein [Actinomycetota bacterium]